MRWCSNCCLCRALSTSVLTVDVSSLLGLPAFWRCAFTVPHTPYSCALFDSLFASWVFRYLSTLGSSRSTLYFDFIFQSFTLPTCSISVSHSFGFSLHMTSRGIFFFLSMTPLHTHFHSCLLAFRIPGAASAFSALAFIARVLLDIRCRHILNCLTLPRLDNL